MFCLWCNRPADPGHDKRLQSGAANLNTDAHSNSNRNTFTQSYCDRDPNANSFTQSYRDRDSNANRFTQSFSDCDTDFYAGRVPSDYPATG